MLRVIIAGSRSVSRIQLHRAIAQCSWLHLATHVVSGTARGADTFGEQWAKKNNKEVLQFKPNWDDGKQAGFIRNREMSQNAEGLVAVWNGKSTGTLNMMQFALSKGLRVFQFRTDGKPCQFWEAKGVILSKWKEAESLQLPTGPSGL